jgi:hypothetical protein
MIISVFSAGAGGLKKVLLSHLFKLFFREVELITVFPAIVASACYQACSAAVCQRRNQPPNG